MSGNEVSGSTSCATTPSPRDLDAKRRALEPNTGLPVEHVCAICGSKEAHFGVGVRLLKGQLGTWYFAQHRLEGEVK